jgi:DNA polymerase V
MNKRSIIEEDTFLCFERGVQMYDDLSNVRFLGTISAGFPSPADDYHENRLDLNELVAPHPHTTYFMRVAGDSMIGACIHNGDVVAIDRAITATHKKIVVARLGDRFTLKRLWIMHPKMYLRPENPKYQAVEVSGHPDFEIWGVVTYAVHQVR